MRAFGVIAALLLAVPAASADEAVPVRLHKGQFGASARLSLGVRGIASYENSIYCGETDLEQPSGFARVCTGRSPMALDLELSYGVKPKIELVLEIRLGLERDVGATPMDDGPRPFHLSPGARFFFSDAKGAKLFVQPQVVLDFAGYANGNDFGIRGIEGLWIDLHQNYGVYVFVAETLGLARWLSATFEGGIGFQGRYP